MKFNRCYILLVIIFVLGVVFPGGVQTGNAQSPQPPEPVLESTRTDPSESRPCLQGEPCENENGGRYVLATEETLAEPTAIGDTDGYGYTLTSTTYSWIDATGGTNTGINSAWDITAAISLPWAFPFYGNSYSQLYITGAGYATFDDDNVNYYFTIPDEATPNNLISALTQYYLYSNSKVYYRDFGTHFVIQWNNLKDYNGDAYTFEAVLYPTGNIKFQYKTLPDSSSGWYCSRAGIEGASGFEGLAFWNSCTRPPSVNTAVLFTKPAASARVSAFPLYLGEFASALDVDDFTFTLNNTGDLGADTYDMQVTTAPLGMGWNVELFNAATLLPLGDTDADGTIDSGLLTQGASMEILVRVSAPAGLSLGAQNKTYVDVTSSLNTGKTKTITIESTVPAAFAQTYRDYKDYEDNALKTDLNWSSTQLEVDVDAEAWNAYEPAIVETPEHNFVQVWSDYRCGVNTCGYALHYAVIDRFGSTIKSPETLSSFYDEANFYTNQGGTALAAAPDGKIGVVWNKTINDPAGLDNYNIWFAVLNPTGSLAYGPVNLTNDNTWGSYQTGNTVRFFYQDVSASMDNRFMVTWMKYVQAVGSDDIYYTILQSSGSQVVPITKMTSSTSTSYYYPNVQIALTGNRFFVAYQHIWQSGQYYYEESLYRVFDSSGGTLTPAANLDFYPTAAVQLSGGNILLAGAYSGEQIRYQILNGTTYGLIAENQLSHPTAKPDYNTLSVTKDANNRGVLTWSDENNRYLYYALVLGTNGAVLTNPVIFHRSHAFELSRNGSGITTNSWSPATGVDLLASFSSDLFGGEPGGVAPVLLKYANTGTVSSTSTNLVLTLPAGLNYVGDTSGITPVAVGNTITWALPNLAFTEGDAFQVYLTIESGAAIGTLYPIGLEISSAGVDANPADNSDSAQVFAGLPCYLPLINR